ncbi:hypothetical protein ACTPEM_22720, partial [Clostridioides difficile]
EEKLDKRVQKDFQKYTNKKFEKALDDLLPKKLIPVIINLSEMYRDGAPIILTKDIPSAEEDTDLDPWFGVSPVPVYAIGGESTL